MHGNAKRESFAQVRVVKSLCIGEIGRNLKQAKTLIANSVKKSFMFQDGELKSIKENIVLKNVIGKTNREHQQARETHNISTEEQKNIRSHFTFQLNGEDCENGFMNEIIMNVKSAGNTVENCTPIMSFQSENVKTLSENQILSPCAEHAINNIIVLNNRQEVKT